MENSQLDECQWQLKSIQSHTDKQNKLLSSLAPTKTVAVLNIISFINELLKELSLIIHAIETANVGT